MQRLLLAGSGSQGTGARSTGRLVSALTHDLRAPLASILEYTELFANSVAGTLGHRHGDLLKRVQSSTERMQGMLNNLITLRAMDGQVPVLELAHVDVTKLIEVALARCKFRLEEKELQTRLEIGVLPKLQADPAHMQQIVDNLVSYACRSSRVGATMGIRAYALGQDSGARQLHITVSSVDTGSEIAAQGPGHAPRRVLHHTRSARGAHSEEGQAELEIIKTLVGAHQGQIVCENEPGTGTMLHLTVPIEPVPAWPSAWAWSASWCAAFWAAAL